MPPTARRPRNTTPAKTAVAKKTAPPAKVTEPPVEEPPTAEQALSEVITKLPFHGREIVLVKPQPEQILAMLRFCRRYENADTSTMKGPELVRASESLFKMLDVIVPDPDDIEHIEDLLLRRVIKLPELADVIVAAVAAVADEQPANRQERRHGKAKLATTR